MENIIIIVILVFVASAIIWYLWRAKKRGNKCVGCPYGKQCVNKGNCSNKSKEQNKD